MSNSESRLAAADNSILEVLAARSGVGFGEITKEVNQQTTGLTLGEEAVRHRCKKLVERGFITKTGVDKYSITRSGRVYLAGDIGSAE